MGRAAKQLMFEVSSSKSFWWYYEHEMGRSAQHGQNKTIHVLSFRTPNHLMCCIHQVYPRNLPWVPSQLRTSSRPWFRQRVFLQIKDTCLFAKCFERSTLWHDIWAPCDINGQLVLSTCSNNRSMTKSRALNKLWAAVSKELLGLLFQEYITVLQKNSECSSYCNSRLHTRENTK